MSNFGSREGIEGGGARFDFLVGVAIVVVAVFAGGRGWVGKVKRLGGGLLERVGVDAHHKGPGLHAVEQRHLRFNGRCWFAV
jgi:hypothetical protein